MARSVRFHEFAGPNVLKIEDVVVPDPGFQEVRLRVEAIGLNRSQVLTRSGRSVTKPTLPEAYAAMSRIDAISSTSAAKRSEQLGKVDILFGVAFGPVPVGRLTVSKIQLAKNVIDVGLSTNNLEPMLRFWQQHAGFRFDHVLPIRRRQKNTGWFGRETQSSRYLRQEANKWASLLLWRPLRRHQERGMNILST